MVVTRWGNSSEKSCPSPVMCGGPWPEDGDCAPAPGRSAGSSGAAARSPSAGEQEFSGSLICTGTRFITARAATSRSLSRASRGEIPLAALFQFHSAHSAKMSRSARNIGPAGPDCRFMGKAFLCFLFSAWLRSIRAEDAPTCQNGRVSLRHSYYNRPCPQYARMKERNIWQKSEKTAKKCKKTLIYCEKMLDKPIRL